MMDDDDAENEQSEDEDDILTMLRKRREQQLKDKQTCGSAEKGEGKANYQQESSGKSSTQQKVPKPRGSAKKQQAKAKPVNQVKKMFDFEGLSEEIIGQSSSQEDVGPEPQAI